VLTWVAPAVAQAAAESGVARHPIQDMQAYKESLERLIARSREFLRPLINRARLWPKRVVFPEGSNTKVLRAAQILVDEGICKPVLLGDQWKIIARAEAANVSLQGIEIVENRSGGDDFDKMAEKLWRLRQRKGFTLARARSALRQRRWYGCMMVREGLADGLVGGLDVPYSQTLRPALKTIGADTGSHGVVSGVYAMLFKDRQIFFADCTVNVSPNAHTLAHIAMNTARVAQSFGVTPKVALLSYSDFGEHRELQEPCRVNEAMGIIRQEWPGLVVDGEMMADTAVNAELAGAFPFSAVQGDANVLVFPDLSAGNIAYKLLRELGGATALGPLLVGLSKPVNVVPTGATVDDIVNIAALTVNQAIGT
jgi:malate dehydrogenase (oxaloacetate-decarboxylating)(NADP+)